MDLNRLEEFTIIAKHLSIKKAAEELHLSPATLSSRLNNFEKSLGTTLFLRGSSSLSLSPSGKKLLSDAVSITLSIQKLKKDIQTTPLTELQHLKIMVVGFGLPFFLGPFLDIISQKNPDLQLDIVDDSYCSIKEGLKDNTIDLAFAPTMTHSPLDGIMRHPIAAPHQYILLPQSHPLADAPSVSMKDLEDETFIIYPEKAETILRDFQLDNLKKSGIRFKTYESDTSSSFYQLLVPIGKGIILTPFHASMDVPNSRNIPIRDISYAAPSTLLYAKDNVRVETKQFITDFLNFGKEVMSNDHRKTI